MQLQLKIAKQERNNRKSVAEEKQEQEGIEGGKGTRRKELDTKTRRALGDCAILGVEAGRVRDSSPAAAS